MRKYNILKLSTFFVAFVGLIDSLYLSWVKLSHTEVYCAGSSACQTVNLSPFSEIAGVPIALLGVGAYLIIMVLLYLERRGDFWEDNSNLVIFGISLIGVLYSVYLTYIEIAVLRAICPYCVVSAIAMVLLLGLTIVRLIQGSAGISPIREGG